MVLTDRPEVRAVAEFLSTPEGIQSWIEAGSAISANVTTPADWYAGSYKLKVACGHRRTRRQASASTPPTSCPAPSVPGRSGHRLINWVNNGGTDTDAVLKAIDDSWPASNTLVA